MPTSSVNNVTRSVAKLLELVDRQQLVLPEIQRDFVWTRKVIKLLIDSLYRGLPVGHMLVWKAAIAVDAKAFNKKRLKRGIYLDGFYGYLLDGQQRLTALAHLRDGDEEYPLMFYVWPDRKTDGHETFYWRSKTDQDDAWCIPVAEVLSDNFSLTKQLNAIKLNEYFKPDHEEVIRRDIESLSRIMDYSIGVNRI